MPSDGNIPLGLDPIDLMPCGCAWADAMVELWAILQGIWTQRQTNNKIAVGERESSLKTKSTNKF